MTSFALLIISLSCLIAYLVGSIPFGFLLAKLGGVGDIRQIGSGNIGATNMLRTGRKGLAALTLFLDFAKGALAVPMAQGFCNYFFIIHSGDFVIPPSIDCYAGVSAVLGHVFPIWLNFKGGKGVATTLGVLLVTQPALWLLTVFGWIMIFYLTRISSLAAIGSITATPILAFLYPIPKEGSGSPPDVSLSWMALVLAVIVVAKHKDNILRLRAGTETKWRSEKK